ncbi:uncharacterized protein LOC123311486 [Coccinella septempunctata]|uniref:uncharacterized protein LOC123311486 n=1 Tax=Coccinella septempunctata TaxID=41139 RepID=UPI001D073C42|nr:uncharacterized protein LOC123311486 [Coccinella septempunctata]
MHFLCVASVLLLIHANQALDDNLDGNCYVENITDNDWNTSLDLPDPIKDNDTHKVIFSETYKNIERHGPCYNYFCIKLDKEKKLFTITPSSNFSQIDRTNHVVNGNSVRIVSTIGVTCADGKERTLTFAITVIDINDYDPVFLKNSYTYTMPMPMSPKNSITNFGDEIIVQDFDFSNQNIIFTSDFGSELTYETSYVQNYSYKLQLEFNGVEKLTADRTFQLTATDTGDPPRHSTVPVTFKIDEKLSEPPSFTQPSYFYDYILENTTLVARNGQSTKLAGSRSGLQCDIPEDAYSSFFNIALNGEEVDLTIKTPFSKEIIAEGIVRITVECYVSKDVGVSEADVIIIFPKSTTEEVKFLTKKYTAHYEINGANHEIKMTDTIELTESDADVDIKIENELDEYFEMEVISGGWTLAKKNNLDEKMLKNTEINIIITLSKKADGSFLDDAFITLFLPNGEEGVDFTQSFFTGNYTFDDDAKGAMPTITIPLNNKDFDFVDCKLEDSEYSEYFNAICDESGNVELNLVKSIPKDLLQRETVPLSLYVDLKLGEIQRRIKTAIFLTLSYEGSDPTSSTTDKSTTTTPTGSTTETTPKTDTDDCSHTGWIITTIVLLIILIAYVILTVIYYFKRMRNRTETDFSEDFSEPVRRKTVQMVEQRPSKRTSGKFKDVSTRRPTGFIRYNPDQDRNSVDSDYGDAQKEVNNNTHANRFLDQPEETSRKNSDVDDSDKRSIGFAIPPPMPEPLTLNDELKRAVEERGNRY